jgi:hypothetical protein
MLFHRNSFFKNHQIYQFWYKKLNHTKCFIWIWRFPKRLEWRKFDIIRSIWIMHWKDWYFWIHVKNEFIWMIYLLILKDIWFFISDRINGNSWKIMLIRKIFSIKLFGTWTTRMIISSTFSDSFSTLSKKT